MMKEMRIELISALQQLRLRCGDKPLVWASSNLKIGRDGYTPEGVYYGAGNPVYDIECVSDLGDEQFWHTVRARDRASIMGVIREVFPKAHWYRAIP